MTVVDYFDDLIENRRIRWKMTVIRLFFADLIEKEPIFDYISKIIE